MPIIYEAPKPKRKHVCSLPNAGHYYPGTIWECDRCGKWWKRARWMNTWYCTSAKHDLDA